MASVGFPGAYLSHFIRVRFLKQVDPLPSPRADQHGGSAQHDERYREVSRQLISVERETAIHLRDQGRISDESLCELLNELDLEESHLATT